MLVEIWEEVPRLVVVYIKMSFHQTRLPCFASHLLFLLDPVYHNLVPQRRPHTHLRRTENLYNLLPYYSCTKVPPNYRPRKMSGNTMKGLSVVRREEENEAMAQQNESDRQVGNDNVASYDAARASEDAAENANNLAEVGANDGYEQAQEEERPRYD